MEEIKIYDIIYSNKIINVLGTQDIAIDFEEIKKQYEPHERDLLTYRVHIDEQSPLDDAKSVFTLKLKRLRDEVEKSPVLYNNRRFDYDEKSIMRIDKARGFMGRNKINEMEWTTADNGRVVMTVGDFDALDDTAAFRSNVLHIKYNIAKQAIAYAVSEKQIEEIMANAFADLS